MAVGTAMLIAGLVKAGIDIYKGHKEGDAAKKAAATQVAAATKASDIFSQGRAENDAAFKNAQAQYQPYVTMGQQAMSMLGATGGYTGVPTGAPALGATTPTAAGDTGQPLLSDPANDQIRQAYKTYLGREPTLSEIMSQTGKGEFGVQDPRLALSVENIRYSPEAQARATNAPQPQNQSGYTKMRGPDGSMKDVPAQHVNHYTQLGAQVIG